MFGLSWHAAAFRDLLTVRYGVRDLLSTYSQICSQRTTYSQIYSQRPTRISQRSSHRPNQLLFFSFLKKKKGFYKKIKQYERIIFQCKKDQEYNEIQSDLPVRWRFVSGFVTKIISKTGPQHRAGPVNLFPNCPSRLLTVERRKRRQGTISRRGRQPFSPREVVC